MVFRVVELLLVCLAHDARLSDAFVGSASHPATKTRSLSLGSTPAEGDTGATSRRRMLQNTAIGVALFQGQAVQADFTPGGTLVDRQVGVQVGNPQASPSRKPDNSNVLFSQDNYFKFGQAAPWIEPGSVDFPKIMPFTPSQQRYDALKKYGDRIQRGMQVLDSVGDAIRIGGDVTDPSVSDVYALRPMGLLANSFLASENTGTTNELLLSRWYINEIYLDIGDICNKAQSKEEAVQSHQSAKKALNSYLSMINRVITSKVGDKFDYLSS